MTSIKYEVHVYGVCTLEQLNNMLELVRDTFPSVVDMEVRGRVD